MMEAKKSNLVSQILREINSDSEKKPGKYDYENSINNEECRTNRVISVEESGDENFRQNLCASFCKVSTVSKNKKITLT